MTHSRVVSLRARTPGQGKLCACVYVCFRFVLCCVINREHRCIGKAACVCCACVLSNYSQRSIINKMPQRWIASLATVRSKNVPCSLKTATVQWRPLIVKTATVISCRLECHFILHSKLLLGGFERIFNCFMMPSLSLVVQRTGPVT